ISGFVIVLTAKKLEPGFSSVLTFIKHRFTRILPVYYVILLISFLVCGGMSTFYFENKTENLISAVLFKPFMAQHAPFYVDDGAFLGVRWTLNYEMMFYVVMSLSLFTKYRWYMLAACFCVLQLIIPLLTGQQPSLSLSGYQFENIYLMLAT
ncbi:acyltransferase, partial [Erwinia amylovora]|uniref:acyltransferase n=1 Tax=Erwinia amylovora TaxID=552 RepID=UPI0015D48942